MSSTRIENLCPSLPNGCSYLTQKTYDLVPINYQDEYVGFNKKLAMVPISALKALTIDAPLGVMFGATTFVAQAVINPYKALVATVIYEIRSDTRELLNNLGFDPYTNAVITSVVSGAIKGALLGQPLMIPSINILFYEMCNSIDYCANDPRVNIPLTIFAETVDATLQTINGLGAGNLLALGNAASNLNNIYVILTSGDNSLIRATIKEVGLSSAKKIKEAKLHEIVKNVANEVSAGAHVGLKVGVVASALVHGVLVPSLEVGEANPGSILPNIEDFDLEYMSGVTHYSSN